MSNLVNCGSKSGTMLDDKHMSIMSLDTSNSSAATRSRATSVCCIPLASNLTTTNLHPLSVKVFKFVDDDLAERIAAAIGYVEPL